MTTANANRTPAAGHNALPLSASGLHKHFGTTHALRGVALDVSRGQICALLGQNGAGKTTFIHCALGLLAPDRGRISVLGHAAGSRAARDALGVMLQDSDLPDLLTAREHLTLFGEYYRHPQEVDALIDTTGIGAFADRRYKQLSGGQKRRVQFAVALVGRPQVLFLDEPTTGLDQDARRAVWANVRRLADAGTTVILTTHYLEEADALADRVVVIHHGRLIADGAADEIRARVGGALIRCTSRVGVDQARALPAVRSAAEQGRLLQLLSDDAAVTLAALLAMDPQLQDLTVTRPSLDEAFAALTQRSGAASAHAASVREVSV